MTKKEQRKMQQLYELAAGEAEAAGGPAVCPFWSADTLQASEKLPEAVHAMRAATFDGFAAGYKAGCDILRPDEETETGIDIDAMREEFDAMREQLFREIPGLEAELQKLRSEG